MNTLDLDSTPGPAVRVAQRTPSRQAVRRAHQLLIDQILFAIETTGGAGESRLQLHGKGAFRRSIEQSPPGTPAETALRLFDAIAGYVWDAYRASATGPDPAGDFEALVYLAVGRGHRETLHLLRLLGDTRPSTERALQRTLDLLRARLQRWFVVLPSLVGSLQG